MKRKNVININYMYVKAFKYIIGGYRMRKVISANLLLIILLFAFMHLTSCYEIGVKDEYDTDLTYPIVSYLPHHDTALDDRWVSVRYASLNEALEARDLLIENGVEISDEKQIAFDYRSDDYVVKYWFDGILTVDSVKLVDKCDYYELKYESATLECYLYFNTASADNLPQHVFLKGPHSYTYPKNMFGYAHSRISVVKGADIPENIDTDKLIIEIPEKADLDVLSPLILHKVTYEGEEIIHILSAVYWTEELFDKVKHTLVVY